MINVINRFTPCAQGVLGDFMHTGCAWICSYTGLLFFSVTRIWPDVFGWPRACLQLPSLFVVLCWYGLHQHMSVLGLYTVHVDGGEGVMCSQHTSLAVWTCMIVWERRTCLGSRLCRSNSLVGQGVLAPASSAQTLCGVSKGLAGLASC